MIYLTEPQPPAISEDAPVLCAWMVAKQQEGSKEFYHIMGADSKNKYCNQPQNHITISNSTMKH